MEIAPQATQSPKKNILVKFLAHSGLCSRRKAEALIKMGEISVNNFTVRNPSYVVEERDTVRHDKRVIKPNPNPEFMYLVLNKPVGMLCTAQDPEGRPTIFSLLTHPRLKNVRLYNVGRLDRNTSGAILVTNDGMLAQRMTHPSFEVPKTYAATLHKALTEEKVEQIRRGVQLEDCFVRVDRIETTGNRTSPTALVTLHSGKNRIIRRIFEQMGFFVAKLDRISIGPVSKKGLAKGEVRFLNKKEIAALHKQASRVV